MVLGNAQTTVVFVPHSTVAVHHVASRLPYRLDRPRRSNEGVAGRNSRISADAAAFRCTLIACIISACARCPANGGDKQRNDRCPISMASRGRRRHLAHWTFVMRDRVEPCRPRWGDRQRTVVGATGAAWPRRLHGVRLCLYRAVERVTCGGGCCSSNSSPLNVEARYVFRTKSSLMISRGVPSRRFLPSWMM